MKKQLITTLMALFTIGAGAQNMLPYQNPNLSAEERADDLISRLTIEEKTALMMDQSTAIERLGIHLSNGGTKHYMEWDETDIPLCSQLQWVWLLLGTMPYFIVVLML